jgi:hypothetical protein
MCVCEILEHRFHLEMERDLRNVVSYMFALYLSVDCDTSFQNVLYSLKLSGCDVSFSMHGT